MSIRDFPPELLELIFLECHNEIDFRSMLPLDTPLLLTRTCKRWDKIARGFPPLWSKLRVVASHAESEPPVRVVEKWMEHSGSHPLSLSLVCQRPDTTSRALEKQTIDDGQEGPTGVSRVLELFLLNIYRWRDILFDFSQHAPPRHYPPSLTEQGAPQLERFEIYPFSWSRLLGSLTVPWLDGVLSAPVLTSFVSHHGQFPSSFLLHVPWEQLTYVHLESGLSDFACLFILQSACNLIECHLLNIRSVALDVTPASDAELSPVLPRLKKLGLASQVWFGKIFNPLITPNLTKLELGTRSMQMRWTRPQFMDFLRRSGCSIESLTLRDMFVSRLGETGLIELLMHLSDSLTDLRITSDHPGTPVGIRDSMLHALSYRPESPVLCSQLESLVLQVGAFATDGELGKMVQSRWKGHLQAPARIARLQHIDVVFSTDTHATDLLVLNELLEQGLDGKVRMPDNLEDQQVGNLRGIL
ncbi:HORMA domain-containing protein [Favolaschia claudopus]|uniref:HORMA domain-containing protein n=1 Tax=Favolaschia claudopus TaxID=2862362 RepID=A0AAW0CGD7_9AGAR